MFAIFREKFEVHNSFDFFHIRWHSNFHEQTMASGRYNFCSWNSTTVFSNLNIFSKFKVGILEAELRGKMQEADQLLKTIRHFIVPSAKISSICFAHNQRIGPIDDHLKEQFDFQEQILKGLKECKVNGYEIKSVKEEFHKASIPPIPGLINSRINDFFNDYFQQNGIDQNINSKRNEKARELGEIFSNKCWITLPSQINKHIESFNFLNDTERKKLAEKVGKYIQWIELYTNSRPE